MIRYPEKCGRPAIRELKQEVENAGLHIAGIESVNVHDAIKIGSRDREYYIGNYIKTLENLGKEGIRLVCYNFMPVFDRAVQSWEENGRTVPRYWPIRKRLWML